MAENIDYVAARALNSVEIKLKRDGPNLIKKIWDWEILPSPEKGRFDYYHNPIGAGAFRFSHREGDRLVCLEANEDYHGKIPYLKRICWHYEPDKEKTWGRLLAGKTDVAQDVLPYNAEIMEKFSGRFHFSRSPSSHITLLLFNTRMELFSKAEVRRAITHAIDRKYIVEKILKGRGKTISGPFGINSPYYNPDIPFPLEHDPQKAMALLKKAGWRRDETGWLVNGENEPFEFTLFLIRENSMDLEIGQYLQLALNDLGIRVRLISLTIHNFLHRYIRNTDFQAVLTEVTGLHNIPENLKNLWAGDKNLPSAMGTFENKRLTFLIQHFLDKTGMDEKKRLGIEIQKAFQEIQPATFLYQKASLDVLSKRIRCASDFMFDYSGAYGLKYAQVVKE